MQKLIIGYIITIVPMSALIGIIIYIPYIFYLHRNGTHSNVLSHLIKYSLIVYMVSLIYITIFSYQPNSSILERNYFLNIKPFNWLSNITDVEKSFIIRQIIYNIFLFIPYGLLLPAAVEKLRKCSRIIIVVMITTISIEVIQYFIGRSADIDDIIMNLLGGILGYCLFLMLNKCFCKIKWWRNAIGHKL